MFGVRTSQVFTSRWKAMLWAAGVLTTAYCTIPAADDEQAPDAVTAQSNGPSGEERQAKEILDNLNNLKSQ